VIIELGIPRVSPVGMINTIIIGGGIASSSGFSFVSIATI